MKVASVVCLATQCEMNVKLCCTCWSANSACAATSSKWPYTAPPYEAVLVASFTACAARFQVSGVVLGVAVSGVVALPEPQRFQVWVSGLLRVTFPAKQGAAAIELHTFVHNSKLVPSLVIFKP